MTSIQFKGYVRGADTGYCVCNPRDQFYALTKARILK
jgi:hypothetical protein